MQNIQFKIRSSKIYLGLFCICAAAAVIAIVIANLPLWLQAVLILLTFIYAFKTIKAHFFMLSKNQIIKIQFIKKMQWQVSTSKETFLAELQKDSTVTTLVSVLRFIGNKKQYATVIFFDALSRDDYRRLRVLLKCH